jgi:hypothetical protein
VVKLTLGETERVIAFVQTWPDHFPRGALDPIIISRPTPPERSAACPPSTVGPTRPATLINPGIGQLRGTRGNAAGVHFGCVLADAGYGLSAPFRQALTARKLAWAVGIPRHLKVYSADVQMVWPVAKRGRPRQRHVPFAVQTARIFPASKATMHDMIRRGADSTAMNWGRC